MRCLQNHTHVLQIGPFCRRFFGIDLATAAERLESEEPEVVAASFLLKAVADQVVTDEEKVMMWCQYPASQLFFYGALSLLQLDVRLYTADMSAALRTATVQGFTMQPKAAMVGSCGLNLQHMCRHVHPFDTPRVSRLPYKQLVGSGVLKSGSITMKIPSTIG